MDMGSRYGVQGGAAPLGDLPLARTTIDYDVAARADEGLIDRLLDDPATRVVLVDRGHVAVPRGLSSSTPAALACAEDPAAPRPDAAAPMHEVGLSFMSGPSARSVAEVSGALVVYLGIERFGDTGVSYLALDVTRAGGASVLPDQASCDWVELRSLAPCASVRDAGLATSAIAVCAWHDRQRFCPYCGFPVRPTLSGWAQACTNPEDAERLLFPRIEPAVITAIVDDRDRLLLQHNRAWRPSFYSVSAGFVEAGESLERAVRREALEEVGIELDEVGYLGSQPWPFPSSIMLGFRARARTTDIHVDGDEVEAALWFTREELGRAIACGEVEPAGRASIARHMIEQWYGGPLECL